MTKPIRMLTTSALFAVLATCVEPASAARRSNAVGMSVYMSHTTCFGFDFQSGSPGVAVSNSTSTCTGGFTPPTWVVPLHLDSTGAKTVKLTLKQTAANQVTCVVQEYSPTGALVQNLAYSALPVGSYATVSKNITVTTGDSVSVLCAFNMQAADITNFRLLSVEY